MSTPIDPARLVQRLARHLRDHPHASDTAEGIARWWLGPAAGASLPEVEAALAWLVACAVVDAVPAADGRVRFRRLQGTAELDARLAAIARDPLAVLPPPRGGPPARPN